MGRGGRFRARELLLLLVAVAVVLPPAAAAAAGGLRSWAWPLRPVPEVVRPAVLPPVPWAPGHRGVDLASHVGAPVRAPADGVVVFAGRVVDRAVVTIRHAGGLRSTLEPVTPVAEVGARVAQGDVVATVAAERGHCGQDPCLHWGVRRWQAYLDPLALLAPAEPPVLLPRLRPLPAPRAAPAGWPLRSPR